MLIPAIFSAEYAKIAAYIVGGFLTARAWFAKEISAGRSDAAKAIVAVKAELQAIEAEAAKLEDEAKAEVLLAVSRVKALLSKL
jgi:hypothetical protein